MPKLKLTFQFVKNLPLPDKTTDYYDTEKKGLFLRMSAAGSKTFYFRYYLRKHRNYKISQYPSISLGDARKIVDDLHQMVLKGIDPREAKMQQQTCTDDRLVFSDLANRFVKFHLPRLKPKTQDDYNWAITKYLIPCFGSTALEELKRRHISDFLEEVAADHPTLANRLQAILSSMLSYALDKEYIDANPIHNLKKKGDEVRRDRILDEEEIKGVWNAIHQQEEPIRTLFKMFILCGQRSGETKRMKWEHIQENGVWVIPASETKKSKSIAKDHPVPLSNFALDLINSLRPVTGNTPFVFVSQSNRVDQLPVTWLNKAVKRIRIASNVKDFRIHDLRRTFASNLAKAGYDRTIIGKVLNHSGTSQDRSVTAIYDQHTYGEEKAAALQEWADRLKSILGAES